MIKIIADSTCDLSQELIKKYNIDILPLHILLGEQEYLDGSNITPDEIYRWSDDNKTTPKTSAVSIEDAISTLKPYVEAGDEVICFTISASMSTTINVMNMAVEELDAGNQVTIIDSANLSTGIGLLVVEAAIMAQDDKSMVEIIARVEELRPRVRASFVVDTLTYLHRGGRCSGLAAMAGGVLKLHPQIVVEDGKMCPDKKYRGKMSKVILDYIKDMESDFKLARQDRVFITHSGCDEDVIKEARQYLEELGVFKEILITRAGGVISSHCGPGTLGVLFIGGK